METLPTTKKTQALDAKRFIAAEVNLSRLPFFASSTKGLRSKKSIRYSYSTEIGGRKVEAVWEVSANAKYGYPGPLSEAVHAAILQITTERGFPIQNPVVFTFYDICKRLDLKPSGEIRRKIRKAIRATRFAGIEIDQSFATKDGRRPYISPDANLYELTIFFGDRDPDTGEPAEFSAVWLADFYRESLNSGYIRPLDFEYFKLIRKVSFVAPKLYEYLGYRFSTSCFKHGNDYTRIDYNDLAVIVDVKRYPYLSAAKRSLNRAHNILISTNFLVREPEWIVEEQGRGKQSKFSIRYYPGKRAREEYKQGRRTVTKQLEIFDDTLAGPPTIIHELTALGVTERRARTLAARHPADRIYRQLDHLEYLDQIGRAPRENVGGWLADAVEQNYTPPTGFKDRYEKAAAQQVKAKADAQRRQKEVRQHEEDRRAVEEREARKTTLDTQLATLPATDQQQITSEIERRIRAGFDNFMRSRYATKPFDPTSAIHQGEYYRHLAELLSHKTP